MISQKQTKRYGAVVLGAMALCLIASMGFFSRAHAAASSNVVQLPSRLIVVGTVDVQNATLTKQVANTFTVDFDLTNQVGAQPNIKYGILLLQQVGASQIVVDTKVYDDVVSLTENDSKHITVTYTAPDFLKGDYVLAVQAKNNVGFPIGTVQLGTVTLQGTGQYVGVNEGSCYLTIPQDAKVIKYTIGQGVDLLPTEDLIAHCDITNESKVAMTATPTFTTHYRSVFGAVVTSTTQNPIDFAPGKTVTAAFAIPKAGDPQSYDTVLTFLDAQGNQVSNSITFHYVIYGESATIQSIVFDKDAYKSGDTAKVSFFWTGSADNFLGSRLGGTNDSSLTANIQITNDQGVQCSSDSSTSLAGMSETTDIEIPIIADCNNPIAKISLSDVAGTVLASSSLAVQSKPNQNGGGLLAELVLAILALVIIITIAWFVIKKRKAASAGKIIGLLMIVGVGMMALSHAAPAHAMQLELDGNGPGLGRVVPPVKSPVAPAPVVTSTFYACLNNACTLVSGVGTDQCSVVGTPCGNAPTSTNKTILACRDSSCVEIPGTGQNQDGCQVSGESCSNGASEGIAAIAFDINLDKSQYAPSAPIIASGDFDYVLCNNGSQLGANSLTLDMTINGATKPIISYASSSLFTSYEGKAIASGQSIFTAESAPGNNYSGAFTINATWLLGGTTYQKTQSGSVPYSVVSSGPSTSLNVVSENASSSTTLVPTAWKISSPSGNLCGANSSSCSGTSGSYPVTATGTYEVTPTSTSPENYALKGVVVGSNIAVSHPSIPGGLFAIANNLFGGVAKAEGLCSWVGSPASSCPAAAGGGALTFTDLTKPGNVIILWNPEGNMLITPQTLSLDSKGSPSKTVTITNTGAPGSELDWNAVTTSTWLSFSSASASKGKGQGGVIGMLHSLISKADASSPSEGAITNGPSQGGASGASQSITLTADPTGLADGTYYATANFGGKSPDCKTGNPCDHSFSLNILFTVGASANPCPNCVTPTSLPTITITPPSTTTTPGHSVTFSINSTSATTCTGSGTGNWPASEPCSGTATVVAPAAVGVYIYTITANNINGSAQSSASVTVTNSKNPGVPGNPPSCQPLTASPLSITPGGTSNLSYDCGNVSSCTMSGGQFSPGGAGYATVWVDPVTNVAASSTPVNPTVNTTYTMTCTGTDGVNTTNTSVDVTVTSPGIIEVPPQ